MASSAKDPSVIMELQKSHVPVPWCDEYEKMISGLKYVEVPASVSDLRLTGLFCSFSTSNSPEMQEYKLGMLRKLEDFNNLAVPENSTLASLKQRRMAVAKSMFGQIGERANIEPPLFVGWGCNVFIGDGVYINRE